MAENVIGSAGLYFDELNKIRVLEPEVAVQTNDLKDECKDFLESELKLGVDVSLPDTSDLRQFGPKTLRT